ncbi:unnamed protein product, partial [Darwinula stevensoni]
PLAIIPFSEIHLPIAGYARSNFSVLRLFLCRLMKTNNEEKNQDLKENIHLRMILLDCKGAKSDGEGGSGLLGFPSVHSITVLMEDSRLVVEIEEQQQQQV